MTNPISQFDKKNLIRDFFCSSTSSATNTKNGSTIEKTKSFWKNFLGYLCAWTLPENCAEANALVDVVRLKTSAYPSSVAVSIQPQHLEQVAKPVATNDQAELPPIATPTLNPVPDQHVDLQLVAANDQAELPPIATPSLNPVPDQHVDLQLVAANDQAELPPIATPSLNPVPDQHVDLQVVAANDQAELPPIATPTLNPVPDQHVDLQVVAANDQAELPPIATPSLNPVPDQHDDLQVLASLQPATSNTQNHDQVDSAPLENPLQAETPKIKLKLSKVDILALLKNADGTPAYLDKIIPENKQDKKGYYSAEFTHNEIAMIREICSTKVKAPFPAILSKISLASKEQKA